MPRYIDADALKAKYEQMLPEIGDGYHKETLQDVLFELEYAPTISPDEARGEGKWLDTPYAIECSKCHEEFDSEVACCDIYGWPWKFCPKCGARMTEVSEDV